MRVLLVVVLATSCGGDDGVAPVTDASPRDTATTDGAPLSEIVPGDPFVVSTGAPNGQDEDPSIAIDPGGVITVAWYSNRGDLAGGREDKEIWTSQTRDGRTWSPPLPATQDPEWAFYPDLAIDATGRYHLAWWRFRLLPAGCTPMVDCTGVDNRLAYSSSADGVTWDVDAELELTAGPGDWLPSIVPEPATGQLRVYFAAIARNPDGTRNLGVGRNHIYMTRGAGTTWSPPVRVSGLDDGTDHNTYPDVVRRADGQYLLTWTRYDGSRDSNPLQVIQTSTSETWVATSSDGLTFTDARKVSDTGGAPAVDAFPHLFTDHAGAAHLTWITTAIAPTGTQIELPFAGQYPADRVVRPEITGYTASIVATATPGVFFAAFVTGAAPTQKITGRFFRRP